MGKKSKVPFRQGRNLCIFCGGTPISREHIWPRWAHRLLPKSRYHASFLATGQRSEARLKYHRHVERQGAVTTFRIPRVCKSCNSGWMGTAEERVRPLLQRMIGGDRVFLDETQRRMLTEYLVMKLLVLDWADNDPLASNEATRAFYQERTIPRGISLHLFNCYEGLWRHAFRSHYVGLSPVEDYVGDDGPRNTKSFALGIGNLFVFSLFAPEGKVNINFETLAALRLWPDRGAQLVWPPHYPINSNEAEFVANTLGRLHQQPNVIDAG